MTSRTSPHSRYLLHGVSITVCTDDLRLRDAAADVLQPAAKAPQPIDAADADAVEEAAADLVFRLAVGDAPEPIPPGAREWLHDGPLRSVTDGEASYLEVRGRYVARYRPACGEITAWIPEDLMDDRWVVAHGVLFPLLLDALRDHGFVTLHAAALAREERIALFPAHSGSGKTTLALALLRGGYLLLSDDAPVLREVRGDVIAFAIPERINVTTETCRLVPELRDLWPAGTMRPHRKVALDVTTLFGDCITLSGRPEAVIFPYVGAEERTSVRPISKAEALGRLLPLTGASVSPAYARSRFVLLSELVDSTACYTMRTGRDFDDIPRIVADLLDGGHSERAKARRDST